VNHIKDAVFLLQAYGIQTAGASEKATQLLYDIDLNIPLAIVMGSEDRGINPSTLKTLDHIVKLPMQGDIASLNVSVACGAMLYEVVRQKL
jgi:23S rRNA (guanosine2251-2'-O)-methyltransferase